MTKKLIILLLLIGLFLISGFIYWHQSISEVKVSKDVFTDVGRLYPTKIREVRSESRVKDLIDVIKDSQEKKLKISISGSRHSQGGHTYYDDAIVLNMRSFNKIKSLDIENKTITVESGATWEEIQDYIAPHGLAVKVMQSSYVFTIGGTMSANAHGRDLEKTTMVETVQSFRLLQSDGSIINVSRKENSELFKLVIGGYGLFGIILDATLELTNDEIYEKKTLEINYLDFVQYLTDNILTDNTAKMLLIRPSIDPNSPEFLKNMSVSVWHSTNHSDSSLFELQKEENVLRDKFFFDLSRRFDWAKSLRWNLQKNIVEKGGQTYVSRNNAMRPPVAPLKLLDYRPDNRTDIIQEYYIPLDNFAPFMNKFRQIIKNDNVNIISSTIRYVKANNEVYWSHTPNRDALAVIVMSNIPLTRESLIKTEKTTQKLVDATIENNGTHYLTYQLFPTKEQIRKDYPYTDYVFKQKKNYDKNELFMSKFYERYALDKEIDYYEEYK